MKIKKSQAALGLTALVLVSTIGISSATLAAGRSHTSASTKSNSTATSTVEHMGKNKVALTDAQKAEMEAKKTAEEAALKANDYNAWVTAVGTSSPMVQKITAANFSRFVELYNLRQQEKTIMTELGFTGNGEGMGMGRGMGLGLGLGLDK